VGVICAALGSVLVRRADGTISSTVRTAWALPVAAVMAHVISAILGESVTSVTWTPTALVALLYVSVFASVLAYIAYFGLLEDAGAIRANLVHYLVPVVATVGGWALLGETITPTTIAGFLVVFTGFAVLVSNSLPRTCSKAVTEFRTAIPTRDRTEERVPKRTEEGTAKPCRSRSD
jgi:drug/metabolite transporter (DMT)-like permease